MVARLHLDDALQTFTPPELAFLKALANSLPKHVYIRASHDEANALLFLFEVKLAQRGTFNPGLDAAALQRGVLQARATLYAGATEAVEALKLSDQTVHIPMRQKCPKCGRQMIERPGKRRREYVCVCEAGTLDPLSEQLIKDILNGTYNPKRYR